jgi:hypothetical protein
MPVRLSRPSCGAYVRVRDLFDDGEREAVLVAMKYRKERAEKTTNEHSEGRLDAFEQSLVLLARKKGEFQ